MARTAWPTVLSGDSWTASQHNTYGRDNDLAYWPYTTAGDLAYASASNTLARLAIGASGSFLKSNGSVPSWVAGSVLHAKALVDWDASDQVVTTVQPTWTDVTNATVNVVTTVTCTILMLALGGWATNTNGNRGLARVSIGGTVQASGYANTSMAFYTSFTLIHYRTGVGAGTITCKLQGAGNAASNQAIFNFGKIIVLAFAE